MNKSGNMFFRILDIFTHFLLLNVMWFICCIPIVTIFPATAALFGVARKWAFEGIDAGLFSLFVQQFKANFKKSFILGVMWTIASLIIAYDFYILHYVEFTGKAIVFNLLSLMTVLYLFTSIHLFFIMVHYELTILQILKNSIFVSISYIFHTILCFIIIGLVIALCFFVPVFLLVAGSILAFTLSHILIRLSQKIQQVKTAT
ncbi:YesL family protein [Radiobacillus sp. PE A8.2]|uniref:YesL family protein n=1 Tax=Radiobacillus sp. PE A8.2 TaxID=3380349 RepID=UPI00388DB21C